ncbi:MAG: cation:proton antiporter [Armatimonadota bacterium]|nr:cation:proton antiporter [Armatimonadota bacterium]MDR7451015.1 cation:proton antiporter [Armatimonadota bacterium]MDR7465964.1 cation:proton antiporter [Armatimonadota bacterium]MDR7494029.1 cation:proton antiporter [Armatimonadota bacterium]MDR7498479.1 cation:proton antiporter [Armatimonadota bacterium]
MTLVAFAMLSLALVLAFTRLARGPTLPDRVVALDLISALAVGIIGVYSIETNQRVLIEVAIVLALISFLGTVAFARYLERRARAE